MNCNDCNAQRAGLFLLIYDLVGAAGDLEGLGVLLDEGVDVADALLLEDLLDGDEDAGLLDVAEAVVDGGAEELHRGREAHVGVHQRRDVVAQLADLGVEDAVVFLESGCCSPACGSRR